MLRIYNWKMFTSYCFSTKISVYLYQKGWQLSCHLIPGRNDKDLSPVKVYLILFEFEVKEFLSSRIAFYHLNFFVRIYKKGGQFSCHLVIGRNVKELSLENVHLILF